MTIITYGRMVPVCLEAAENLAAQGISIEVVDPRTLNPLDKDTLIKSAKKTGRVLVVHEACQTGGFGGELAAVIADSEAFFYLDAPVKRLAVLMCPYRIVLNWRRMWFRRSRRSQKPCRIF